jgi:hypothetical protein
MTNLAHHSLGQLHQHNCLARLSSAGQGSPAQPAGPSRRSAVRKTQRHPTTHSLIANRLPKPKPPIQHMNLAIISQHNLASQTNKGAAEEGKGN